MDSLRIAQYNIQSANNKKPLLINFLAQENIDICLLNETWFKDNTPFNIFGYNLHFRNAKNKHGGVAILIRSYLKYSQLHTTFYEDIQNIAISLSTQNGTISVLCVYCPPSSSGRFKTNKLRSLISNLPSPVFISGDFNAHHIAFGCITTKGRGQPIYDIIDDSNLCIINDGNFTTLNNPNHNPSAIDITFVSPCIAPLCEWSVYDNNMGSYHFPTITTISLNVIKYKINPPVEKYLYNKTNWDNYCELSKDSFKNISIDDDNPLLTYDLFCNHLNNLKNECVPKFIRTTDHKIKPPVPWWNEQCKQSVINSYEALKYYRKNPNVENYINYKKLDAIKKRVLAEERKNGWNDLCNSFNRTTPISKIWNSIRMFKNKRKTHNRFYSDEFIDSFLDKLSDKGLDIPNIEAFFDNNNENENTKFLLEKFSFQEFMTSLQSRKNTSPGLDDLPYILIKKLHSSAQIKFLDILNCLWSKQIIPLAWKTQCVIPLLKPDKPPNNPNSYRPISLSSCLGKIFENMIKLRLDWFIESNGIIPHVQFGFRCGRSCADSFVSLVSDLKYAKNNKSNVICTFLDVQGAFDNVQPGILIQILSQMGIPGLLCKWIYNFLIDRIIYVKHNNILHGPRTASKGTMQGAILSPILYNLYTSEICKYVNTNLVNILQYADDLVLYAVDNNLKRAEYTLNDALKQLQLYYNNRLNLDINTNKSSTVTFGDTSLPIEIKFKDQVIPQTDQHKFLGIVLDGKLNFKEHIKYVTQNALKSLNILRCLAGVSWGADPKTLTMLYKSIVRSHFDYSSLAYFNCNCTNRLDVIQNKALRIISGAICSTPIRAMEVETAVMPLAIRRLLLARRYCIKLISNNNQSIINKIMPFAIQNHILCKINGEDLLNCRFPELSQILHQVKYDFNNIYSNSLWPYLSIPYKQLYIPPKVINASICSNQDLLQFLDHNTEYYKIFTDGSKGTSYVRSAIYDSQINFIQSFLLDNRCSIFTAEAYAILEALKHIYQLQSCKKVLILTDSLSFVNNLKSYNTHFKTNYLLFKIKELLYSIKNKGLEVFFMWIPSHRGIKGNEIADKAAYEGINNLDVSCSVKIPFTDCYQNINMDLRNIWKNFWLKDLEEKGKWYGSIQTTLPTKPWYNNLSMASRDFITTINRLRFGHSATSAHLHRLGIVDNMMCINCNEAAGTIEHIIFDCPVHRLHRLILASELIEKIDITKEESRRLNVILQNKELYMPLYTYIKNTIGKI